MRDLTVYVIYHVALSPPVLRLSSCAKPYSRDQAEIMASLAARAQRINLGVAWQYSVWIYRMILTKSRSGQEIVLLSPTLNAHNCVYNNFRHIGKSSFILTDLHACMKPFSEMHFAVLTFYEGDLLSSVDSYPILPKPAHAVVLFNRTYIKWEWVFVLVG